MPVLNGLAGVTAGLALRSTLRFVTRSPLPPKPTRVLPTGSAAGQVRTVPPAPEPEPTNVTLSLAMLTASAYTPGSSTMVSPGDAPASAAGSPAGPTTTTAPPAAAGPAVTPAAATVAMVASATASE